MKYIFLLTPIFLALWAPFYNRIEPSFFGVPFFYVFQLILIPLCAVGIYLYDRNRKT